MDVGRINVTALRDFISARDLSARATAKKAQISPSYLCKILAGTKNPQPAVALRLANALGVKLASIYAISPEYRSRFVLIDMGPDATPPLEATSA